MEIVELTKASCPVVDSLFKDLIEESLHKARHNELLTMVNSFGTNFNLENSCITVSWVSQIWDKNDDKHPYSEDEIEPVSIF